ncbi:hypothetical protein V6N13_125048 [Hibiscus sabdariffa]|uniref:Uncharacterized protein n=1 Tax=Hibiscus sabdariffa TaxID=183260 RepID=A0ABR2U5A7_9ROSI
MSQGKEEILDNKGPISEASIKRMTRGRDTPTTKSTTTSKPGKGKSKVEVIGEDLIHKPKTWIKLRGIENVTTALTSKLIKLTTTVENMAMPRIYSMLMSRLGTVPLSLH